MLRYRLPDGRSWKRLWEGWVGSLHDAVGFAGACARKNVQDGLERGTDDLCSCCSLSAGGSYDQQHCSSRTRQ